MTYQQTIPLSGNPDKALDALRLVFMQHGFQVTQTDRTSLEVTGPGWQNTKQDAIRGISHARLMAAGHELTVEAELGGARNLMRFVQIFPPALSLGLLAIFYVVFHATREMRSGPGFKIALLVCGINMALWLVIGLLWAPAIKRATVRSLNTLLANAAVIR